VVRGAFLAGMRDGPKSLLSRSSEYLAEFRRRVSDFRGIQSDRGDRASVTQSLLERDHRLGGAQVAQEARYQPGGHAPLPFGREQCTAHTGEHRVERHSSGGVRLRIEEYLDVHYTL